MSKQLPQNGGKSNKNVATELVTFVFMEATAQALFIRCCVRGYLHAQVSALGVKNSLGATTDVLVISRADHPGSINLLALRYMLFA
jgi:hypothetical protein